MAQVKLYPHQEKALTETKNHNRVGYFLDMGLGKTFIASEKAKELGKPVIVICQKSKITDWQEHLKQYDYPSRVINYDLIWRRPEHLDLTDYTLILDESQHIRNESAKRSKFVLRLKPTNIILLSGTPTGGRYEDLWTQCKLLGWPISKRLYWQHYILTETLELNGFQFQKVIGYKNVERLKTKLRQYGSVFMKTEEVMELPQQIEIPINITSTSHYKKFNRNRYLLLKDQEFVGDTSLTKLLYLRQLAGSYNPNKIQALKDLIESNNQRMVIFYNFNQEMGVIKSLSDRPLSFINGQGVDLNNYETQENSITLAQYQAGAMGHNLQKANIIVYFTLPLSSDLFEQSKKRIHRIGQSNACFYYSLITENTVEEQILETLKQRKNFTDELFRSVDQ